MNAPFDTELLEAVDALLMDVAAKVQLSATQHETATQHFNALCAYVDRPESPLAGKVIKCYPTGSFATGTAIQSRVRTNQHDVDVAIELDFPPHSKPRHMLALLFRAINGEAGSRYYGRARQNSRCITVTYEDSTSVDLMPIARLPGTPARAGHLFHFKAETGDEYTKPANPFGFAAFFNAKVELVATFAKAFRAQRRAPAAVLEKADTAPMPDHIPLSEKSPRTVAIQLAKRARDIAFRPRDREARKPPSVTIAGMALEMGAVQPRLIDELIALVTHMERRIMQATHQGARFRLFNPTYAPDEFTDRWPENVQAQKTYAEDLRQFRAALYRLRDDNLGLQQMKSELQQLFGETAAAYAVDTFLEKRRQEASAGQLAFGSRGRVLTGAAAAAGTATRARASTFQGGDYLPE